MTDILTIIFFIQSMIYVLKIFLNFAYFFKQIFWTCIFFQFLAFTWLANGLMMIDNDLPPNLVTQPIQEIDLDYVGTTIYFRH